MVQFEKKGGAESVKVVIRCRPMNRRELDLKCTKCVDLDEGISKVTIMKPNENLDQGKGFTFDAVFDTESNQSALYESTAQPLVESVMEGYNGTIFAYGQTGCGKSYSMMGVPSDPELMGIIPRCFQQIFDTIASNDIPEKKYLVQASYIEIYNEEVRDLLSTNHTARLELKEHPEKGVYVQGMSQYTVSNVAEITKLMEQGTGNRSVGATLMNADSSRSHSIFMVQIETSEPSEAGEIVRQGVLNLVDLAGSERQEKTGATGARLKEATKINLSLSALGNVISALVASKPHIPYRDSKLTRLLQNSLGGNARTVMIAAISPAHDNYEETLSTLRYANRTKSIKNKPKVNEDPRDTMLREYQEEIKRLRELLSQNNIEDTLTKEKVKMIEETKHEMNKLMTETKQDDEHREKLQSQLQVETQEHKQQIEMIEKQKRELELMHEEIVRKEKALLEREGSQKVDQDDELLKMELQQAREELEQELAREKQQQYDLEQELAQKQQESERLKEQLRLDKEEKERRHMELQNKLMQLEQESNAAKVELQKKLEFMERRLMKGGAKMEQERIDAQNRLKKLKAKHMEAERVRRSLEQEAQRLHHALEEKHVQETMHNEEIMDLRGQVQSLQREIVDLHDEFATEKAENYKTIRELSKELMLYRMIARNHLDGDVLRSILANAQYDETHARWSLQPSGSPGGSNGYGHGHGGHGHGHSGTTGGFGRKNTFAPVPPSGANTTGSWRDRHIVRGPTTTGTTSMLNTIRRGGLAETDLMSPQPDEERADREWKKSVRGPTPPTGALGMGGGGMSMAGTLHGKLTRTTTGVELASDIDASVVTTVPKRPAFQPNLTLSTGAGNAGTGTSPTTGGNTSASLPIHTLRARPGFVPAHPTPSASPTTNTIGSTSSSADDATSMLSQMARRPGFQPNQ